MLRIAIDGRMWSQPQPGGFKTYTTELVRALAEIDGDNEYLVWLDRSLPETPPWAPVTGLRLHVMRSIGGWLAVPMREQVRLPLAWRRVRPDVIHLPCNTGPIWGEPPTVVTIHDTIEFFERSWYGPVKEQAVKRWLMSRYSQMVLRRVAQRARAIITVSNCSKRDIMSNLHAAEDKIHVIPNAHARHCYPLDGTQFGVSFCERYGLPEQFILSLASTSPRKNARGLLRIYARLPEFLRRQYPLVIVMTHNLLKLRLQTRAAQLGLEGQVRFLEQLSDADLALAYNQAALFVYPSLYEGFGLPVLEAMACATPVVASNRSSLPEVVGDAAILCDPADEAQFAEAIVAVLLSPARQQALAEAGLRRAAIFSWQATARQTLAVYRSVAD